MRTQHTRRFSRRRFLGGLTLVGTAGLLGVQARSVAAEPPPETTTLRLINVGGICLAPQYVAEELLGGEGFADVQYLKLGPAASYRAVAVGEAHLSMGFVAPQIVQLDAGLPIVLLAGVHIGCFELFGTDRVRTVRNLKGKSIAVQELGSSQHVFTATIVAHVGLDPRKDIHWVTHPPAEQMALLAQGQIDAYLGFPPEPQETPGETDRTRDREQCGRSALVPVLLLSGSWEPGICSEAPYSDQTGAACHHESSRRVRRRTGSCRPVPRG